MAGEHDVAVAPAVEMSELDHLLGQLHSAVSLSSHYGMVCYDIWPDTNFVLVVYQS